MSESHVPASPGPRIAGNEVLLRVRDLRVEFRTGAEPAVAVEGASFDLRECERLGIVGESGSGKSALAKGVLHLLEPPGVVAGGEVHLGGRSLHDLRDDGWRHLRGNEVGLIFQDPMGGFDPLMTVGDQLVEAVRLHQKAGKAAARQMAVQALEEVEIVDAERRVGDYPHQFSGGMLQRVSIAMALINRPRLLIADEPTTALDVTTQARILELINRLCDERGMALVLISHDLGVVAQTCDTVQVMYAGRIIERGPAETVLRSPRHRYTEALLRSVVRRDRSRDSLLPAIPGTPPDLRHLPAGCAFVTRCEIGGQRERCHAERPLGRSYPSPAGSVTAKCHYPAGVPVEGADVATKGDPA